MKSITNYINAWSHIKYENLKDNINSSKQPNLDPSQLSVLKELQKNGVVVLPGYYPEDKCDLIIKEIDRLIIDKNVNLWKDEGNSDNRVYGAHLHSDLIKEFYSDNFLADIGESYLKSPIMNSHTLGAHLSYKPNNLGSGGGWHRDSVYKIQYKSIAYLTDVSVENGPFEYILGTHHKSTIFDSILSNKYKAHQNRMTQEQIDSFMESYPNLERKIFTAKKGTVILVDTGGIHRGMPIESGERYALTNYFFPKHHYTDSVRKKFEVLF